MIFDRRFHLQTTNLNFDLKENLSKGGTAKASGAYQNQDPNSIFSGNRAGMAFSLNTSSGTIDADWKQAIKGRYVVLVNKTTGEGNDLWGKAKIKINNTMSVNLENNFSSEKVLVIDFGKITEIKSISFEIKQGSNNPGLAGLEIYK